MFSSNDFSSSCHMLHSAAGISVTFHMGCPPNASHASPFHLCSAFTCVSIERRCWMKLKTRGVVRGHIFCPELCSAGAQCPAVLCCVGPGKEGEVLQHFKEAKIRFLILQSFFLKMQSSLTAVKPCSFPLLLLSRGPVLPWCWHIPHAGSISRCTKWLRRDSVCPVGFLWKLRLMNLEGKTLLCPKSPTAKWAAEMVHSRQLLKYDFRTWIPP